MVSGLTFRNLFHFDFTIVCSMRKCSDLILLHVAIHFSQHPLLKDSLFSIVYSCLVCHRLIDDWIVSLFLGSVFCSIDLLCLFLCKYYAVFMTIALQYSLKSGRMIPPALFFIFFKIALAIQGVLWFQINFRIICSSSVKNVIGSLIKIALNL